MPSFGRSCRLLAHAAKLWLLLVYGGAVHCARRIRDEMQFARDSGLRVSRAAERGFKYAEASVEGIAGLFPADAPDDLWAHYGDPDPDDDADGQPARHLILAAIEFGVLLWLGFEVVREASGAWCDEPSLPPDRLRGCDFLESGGYDAMPIVPLLVFAGFAIVALRWKRPALVHAGFGVGKSGEWRDSFASRAAGPARDGDYSRRCGCQLAPKAAKRVSGCRAIVRDRRRRRARRAPSGPRGPDG